MDEIVDTPAYAGLVSVFHRATTYGMPVDVALPALDDSDPAADLLARTTTWCSASRPARPASTRHLIDELIPVDQPGDLESRHALKERDRRLAHVIARPWATVPDWRRAPHRSLTWT